MHITHNSVLIGIGLCSTLAACDGERSGAPTAPDPSPSVRALASNAWAGKRAMLTPRSQAKAAAVNGIIYVIGGRTSTGPRRTVEAYNVSANTWPTKRPFPGRRPRRKGASGLT